MFKYVSLSENRELKKGMKRYHRIHLMKLIDRPVPLDVEF